MKINNLNKVKALIEELEKFRELRDSLLDLKHNNIEIALFKKGKNGINLGTSDSTLTNDIYDYIKESINTKIEDIESKLKDS